MKHAEDVATAREQIRLSEAKVVDNRQLVAESKNQGYGVWLAKELLSASEDTLRAHKAHLRYLGAT